MDENNENVAENELSPAVFSLPDDRDDVVDRISANLMGLLGQIEDFVCSIQENTPMLEPEHTPRPRDIPHRLENALRLMTLARDEVSAELNSYQLNESEVDRDERKTNVENSGDSTNENPSKLCSQLDIIKSCVDDSIQLRKVNCEVTRVMKMISNRFMQIGANAALKSSSDADADSDAGVTVSGVSDICSFAIEDQADGQEGGQEEECAKEHNSFDLSSFDDVAQSIRIAAENVNRIAEDVKHVSEGIETMAEIVQQHEFCASALAGIEEQENCEVREKGDFEETEKNDCTFTDDARDEGDDNGVTVPADEAGAAATDSSCNESATGDETEPETTTDDEAAVPIALMYKNSSENWMRSSRSSTSILNEHLMKDKIGVEYHQVDDDDDDRSYSSRYNYTCRVLDMEAVGEGRSKCIAKLQAAVHMLSLIVRRQTNGTLAPDITPFTPAQLKSLEPILDSEVETNSIIILRKECRRLGEKMPSFKTLSLSGPSGERVVTVQCTTLNHTAVGTGHNKRRARRDAAHNIVIQYYKSNVDQE